MPYKKEKDGDNWKVVNEDGETVAVHEPPEAEEKAERQIQLLHEIESDPQWDQDEEEHHG